MKRLRILSCIIGKGYVKKIEAISKHNNIFLGHNPTVVSSFKTNTERKARIQTRGTTHTTTSKAKEIFNSKFLVGLAGVGVGLVTSYLVSNRLTRNLEDQVKRLDQCLKKNNSLIRSNSSDIWVERVLGFVGGFVCTVVLMGGLFVVERYKLYTGFKHRITPPIDPEKLLFTSSFLNSVYEKIGNLENYISLHDRFYNDFDSTHPDAKTEEHQYNLLRRLQQGSAINRVMLNESTAHVGEPVKINHGTIAFNCNDRNFYHLAKRVLDGVDIHNLLQTFKKPENNSDALFTLLNVLNNVGMYEDCSRKQELKSSLKNFYKFDWKAYNAPELVIALPRQSAQAPKNVTMHRGFIDDVLQDIDQESLNLSEEVGVANLDHFNQTTRVSNFANYTLNSNIQQLIISLATSVAEGRNKDFSFKSSFSFMFDATFGTLGSTPGKKCKFFLHLNSGNPYKAEVMMRRVFHSARNAKIKTLVVCLPDVKSFLENIQYLKAFYKIFVEECAALDFTKVILTIPPRIGFLQEEDIEKYRKLIESTHVNSSYSS